MTSLRPGNASIISSKSKAVLAAQSPLGFFVLALGIVETFICTAGALFGISETARLILIGIGVLLFLFVVGLVAWLVIKYPQNLVFSAEAHVQIAALKAYRNETKIPGNVLKELLPVSPRKSKDQSLLK